MLSWTCRQVRQRLLESRESLIKLSLRCDNETASPALRLGNGLNASFAQWTLGVRNDDQKLACISGGSVGRCARDYVDECRRCSRVTCRNCIAKLPISPPKKRLRRLCQTCMKSPLEMSLQGKALESGDEGACRSYARGPCTCEDMVWICRPCGKNMRIVDVAYFGGWLWRNRYATCGGNGAGLGEGNEGVQCGRGGDCLAAEHVERETECDANELAALEAESSKAKLSGRKWAGSSYHTHEMVGIGGRVKIKLKQIVPVGAIVKEHEYERAECNFLQREMQGIDRSWCSWCNRVVLGKKDIEESGLSALDKDAAVLTS